MFLACHLLVEPAIVPVLLKSLRPPLPPQVGKIHQGPVDKGTCYSPTILIEPTQALLLPLIKLVLLLTLLDVVEDSTEDTVSPGQVATGGAIGATEGILLLLSELLVLEGSGSSTGNLEGRPSDLRDLLLGEPGSLLGGPGTLLGGPGSLGNLENRLKNLHPHSLMEVLTPAPSHPHTVLSITTGPGCV